MEPVTLTPDEMDALLAHFRHQYIPYTERGLSIHRLLNKIERAKKEAA